MGKNRTDFIENNFSVLYRKTILDITIYDWISCAKYHIPSLSVPECAKSFLSFNNIDEGELSIDKIVKTYFRIQKELFDEQKTKP